MSGSPVDEDTMGKNNKIRCFLKCVFMFLCTALIALAVAIFVGSLLFKAELIMHRDYLEAYYSKPILFLLVGSIMMFAAGFLGIISAVQNWPQGILTFRVSIIYLFLSMIALGVITYVLSKSADDIMYSELKQHMKNYSLNQETIDKLQIKLSCCGVDDFRDWIYQFGGKIPGSCCNSESTCSTPEIYEIVPLGCFKAFKRLISSYAKILIITLAVLGIIEILAILVSFLFGRALEKRIKEKISEYTNGLNDSVQLPRIHNPLGHIVITRPQKTQNAPQPIYVRRPSEWPVPLTYRNPNEHYLHREPKHRFDLRVPPASRDLRPCDERFQ